MPPSRTAAAGRIAWTTATLVVVQAVVCGVSAAPAVFVWQRMATAAESSPTLWWVLVSVAVVPTYVLFAVCLLIASPLAMRLLHWYTPPDAALRIADLDWELMRWARFGASIHLVRIIAGTLFKGTPLWTFYLRLNGARLGKRVYVNSLAVSDYNLIEAGDDVVIGGSVHMSGHTVEGGIVKTARIRLGSHVTIGLGSVVEIGVEIGSHAQVGALSFVPKYAKLAGDRVYAGAPAVPID